MAQASLPFTNSSGAVAALRGHFYWTAGIAAGHVIATLLLRSASFSRKFEPVFPEAPPSIVMAIRAALLILAGSVVAARLYWAISGEFRAQVLLFVSVFTLWSVAIAVGFGTGFGPILPAPLYRGLRGNPIGGLAYEYGKWSRHRRRPSSPDLWLQRLQSLCRQEILADRPDPDGAPAEPSDLVHWRAYAAVFVDLESEECLEGYAAQLSEPLRRSIAELLAALEAVNRFARDVPDGFPIEASVPFVERSALRSAAERFVGSNVD